MLRLCRKQKQKRQVELSGDRRARLAGQNAQVRKNGSYQNIVAKSAGFERVFVVIR